MILVITYYILRKVAILIFFTLLRNAENYNFLYTSNPIVNVPLFWDGPQKDGRCRYTRVGVNCIFFLCKKPKSASLNLNQIEMRPWCLILFLNQFLKYSKQCPSQSLQSTKRCFEPKWCKCRTSLSSAKLLWLFLLLKLNY